MQFTRTFEERLSGNYHDIFAREAVLAVGGISMCSYGFSIEKQLKSDIQEEAS